MKKHKLAETHLGIDLYHHVYKLYCQFISDDIDDQLSEIWLYRPLGHFEEQIPEYIHLEDL